MLDLMSSQDSPTSILNAALSALADQRVDDYMRLVASDAKLWFGTLLVAENKPEFCAMIKRAFQGDKRRLSAFSVVNMRGSAEHAVFDVVETHLESGLYPRGSGIRETGPFRSWYVLGQGMIIEAHLSLSGTPNREYRYPPARRNK